MHAFHRRRPSRDHDDRNVGITLSQLSADIKTITIGKTKIQQDQIGAPSGERLGDRSDALDAIAVSLQCRNHRRGDAVVVFDNQ